MKIKRKFITACMALLFVSIIDVSAQEVEIMSEQVKKHLYTLASDTMEGRKVGTEGIEKAAQYIEWNLKSLV